MKTSFGATTQAILQLQLKKGISTTSAEEWLRYYWIYNSRMGDHMRTLDDNIKELKNILKYCDTESVLGTWAYMNLHLLEDQIRETGLQAPAKQFAYLANLILSIEEKNPSIECFENNKNNIYSLLNENVNFYIKNFFPEDLLVNLSTKEKNQISMMCFSDYFNRGMINSQNQLESRFKELFGPYNAQIDKLLGISFYDILEFYHIIKKRIESDLRILVKTLKKSKSKSIDKLNKIESDRLKSMFHVPTSYIEENFGVKKSDILIDLFAVERTPRNFNYYTDQGVFETSLIWKKSDAALFIIHPAYFLNGAYNLLFDKLSKGKNQKKFLKHRDSYCENKVLEIFKNLFGEEAEYYPSVFENENSQNEHDLLILHKDKAIIIEMKASKIREPLRDPQRAFPRIHSDFKSDRGIQKAADQAYSLKRYLLSKNNPSLYNKKGKEILTFKSNEIKEFYLIGITLENYGFISSYLAKMIDKIQDDPFPFITNLYDFENIIEAFIKLPKLKGHFFEYLKARNLFHEKIISNDELDILGFYYKEGNFDSLTNSNFAFIHPSYSSFFDRIEFSEDSFLIKPSKPINNKKKNKRKKRKK